MFAVLIKESFTFRFADYDSGVLPVDVGKMIGFLPVFSSKEDAEEEYPDLPIIELEVVDERI